MQQSLLHSAGFIFNMHNQWAQRTLTLICVSTRVDKCLKKASFNKTKLNSTKQKAGNKNLAKQLESKTEKTKRTKVTGGTRAAIEERHEENIRPGNRQEIQMNQQRMKEKHFLNYTGCDEDRWAGKGAGAKTKTGSVKWNTAQAYNLSNKTGNIKKPKPLHVHFALCTNDLHSSLFRHKSRKTLRTVVILIFYVGAAKAWGMSAQSNAHQTW